MIASRVDQWLKKKIIQAEVLRTKIISISFIRAVATSRCGVVDLDRILSV